MTLQLEKSREKIYDLFSVSSADELDLLYIKLYGSNRLIEKWIIVENSFWYSGAVKEESIWLDIIQDSRFSSYLSKVVFLKCSIDPRLFGDVDNESRRKRVEHAQRDFARDYILSLNHNSYVLFSDVDEHYDGNSWYKRKILQIKLGNNVDKIYIPRVRYNYDIDNRWLVYRSTPIYKIAYLFSSREDFGVLRDRGAMRENSWFVDVLFEFSYCFKNLEEVEAKIRNFAHTGETAPLDFVLRYNCTYKYDSSKSLLTPSFWSYKTAQRIGLFSPSVLGEIRVLFPYTFIDKNYILNRKVKFRFYLILRLYILYYILFSRFKGFFVLLFKN